MGDLRTQASIGTYHGFDGSNTSFAGSEMRYGGKKWYVGAGAYLASNDLKDLYGLVDAKAKLAYDSKSVFEQNLRVRTAYDKDVKTTQIRYSPVTVNIPITKDVTAYSNTHYSGKYNFDEKTWSHSIGNFTGVSCKVSKKENIALEVQRYNLQDIKDNSSKNWSFNFILTHNF